MDKKLKIIFVGIPDMALVCLENLLNQGFNIVGVVPPLKSNNTYEYFKYFVQNKNLNFIEMENSPNEPHYIEKIKKLNADIGVVCSYNNLLSKEFLTTTNLGYINCHPSQLPDYRGACPYFHPIVNQEKSSGITLHFMDEKFDTGEIIYQEIFDLEPYETMGTLFNRTTYMLSNALIKVLNHIEKNKEIKSFSQPKGDYKKAPKVSGNFRINWKNQNIKEIESLIRACNPFYNAYTFFRKTNLKIIKAKIVSNKNSNKNFGEILKANENELLISCIDGILDLKIVHIGTWGIFDNKDFYKIFTPKKGESLE